MVNQQNSLDALGWPWHWWRPGALSSQVQLLTRQDHSAGININCMGLELIINSNKMELMKINTSANTSSLTVGMSQSRGRYHGDRRPSSDDSFHSPTVIPPSALDKPIIMKRYHRRRTTRWDVTARSPTMVTLHDTRFVECRWWNDGWTVKTVVTWWSSASMLLAPGVRYFMSWKV